MRLWLVKTGEPWPSDGQHVRLGRTGIMALQYSRAGDQIVWFNEIFNHARRQHMPDRNRCGAAGAGLQIVGLNGRGYRRSVSLSRMFHHADVARDFRARAAKFAQPEVIVSSLIPLELCLATVRYGNEIGVPVVVDVRDLWPEAWLELLPGPVRPAARAALRPYFGMLSEIVDRSAAICGVAEEAVEWALSHGSRSRNAFDGALPLAYEPPDLSQSELHDAEKFWSAKGIARNERILTICFFGNLSHRVELAPVIDAAHNMPDDLRDRIRFVFCGRGEADETVSKAARQLTNFHFAGWVNAAQIEALKQVSDLGLLPYPSSMDFTRSMPNKVFDYLSGGLPLLTCLKGVVEKLVAEEECGWMYGNDDHKSLLSVIGELAGNRERVARASERARRTGTQFSASELYGRFRERLQDLCAADVAQAQSAG